MNSRQLAVFLSQSEAHQSATCHEGALPKLVEAAGYPLAQAFRSGVLGHTPLWSPSFTRYTLKKSKTLDCLEEPREHDQRCRFVFGVDLTENMDVAVGETLCPPFCQGFGGGCIPFCQMLFMLPTWYRSGHIYTCVTPSKIPGWSIVRDRS